MLAIKAGEFAQRDAAFGLETDIDDGEIILDARHDALDDTTFKALVLAERGFEHCCEIITRRLGGTCHKNHSTFISRPAHGIAAPS